MGVNTQSPDIPLSFPPRRLLSFSGWLDTERSRGQSKKRINKKTKKWSNWTYWWWRLRRGRPGNPRWPAPGWWGGPSCGAAAWLTWAAPPPRGQRARRRDTTGTPSTTSLTGRGRQNTAQAGCLIRYGLNTCKYNGKNTELCQRVPQISDWTQGRLEITFRNPSEQCIYASIVLKCYLSISIFCYYILKLLFLFPRATMNKDNSSIYNYFDNLLLV